jgi:hydrogenase maturation protease
MIGVFGIGNTLRHDDGIGIELISILKKSLSNSSGLLFREYGTSSIELLNAIPDFSSVLIIDAVEAGMEPGKLLIFKLEKFIEITAGKKLSSHEFSLADLFSLYSGLGITVPVYVAGIQAKDLSYGEGLSPELENYKYGIAGEIASFIENLN